MFYGEETLFHYLAGDRHFLNRHGWMQLPLQQLPEPADLAIQT